jgi:hypothetical protein
MKYILLATFASILSAGAMDEQQSQKPQDSSAPKQLYVIDYEELYAKGTPDDEITKIHHEEDERLTGIMDNLRTALRMLKQPVENEIAGLIRQALSKVQAEQDNNMHRWSEGFTKRAPQESSVPPVDTSSTVMSSTTTVVESQNKDISQ